MTTLATARPPDGLRLYAVGDVHGERRQLDVARRLIDADLAARPCPDWREVWVGDYVDRGPDGAGVIEALAAEGDLDRRVCLLGNHDAYMADFLSGGDAGVLLQWLANGGGTTFASYGIDADGALGDGDAAVARLRDALAAAMPAHHRAFLDGLPRQARFGDFGFAHAGIRPGVAWEAQDPDDLVWIREAFLGHADPFEVVVVHGHTPSRDVEVRANRINVDTGAGKGGGLSAVAIEAGCVGRLTAAGPEWRVPG